MNKGFVTGTGECYWVLSDGLYQLNGVDGSAAGWTLTKRASFFPGPNVQICDNLHSPDLILPSGFGSGSSLFIVSNGQGWTYDVISHTLATIEPLSETRPVGGPDSDYTTVTTPVGASIAPISCAFMDGYVVFALQDSNQFYWTNLYGTVIDALSYASAEVNSDPIVGLLNNNEDLWVFGNKTIEIWYDAGASAASGVGSSTVFSRKQGLLLETGCVSCTTVCKVQDNRIAWLATNERGGPIAVMTDGYSPIRISTYAIEQLWSNLTLSQLSEATAFVYTQEGHTFYCLNIPGLTSTWVYDLTTSTALQQPTWHERTYTDPRTGQQSRWKAEGHVYYKNRHVVSDYQTGAMYFLDPDGYTDNGDPITRQRTAPHLSNEGKRLFYNSLQLDVKTGMGDNTTLEPSLMLEYSNDGGNTWSNVITKSIGPQGAYVNRVIFNQLGQSRDRVFRMTFTDPVDFAISGANLDITPGEY